MKKNIVIACSKDWFFRDTQVKKFIKQKNIFILKKKKKLNIKNLNKINPKYIFFPHWGYKVEDNILENFKCICFHTAPLPFGRGGSPIQNLIKLGFKKSTVLAIKMEKILDSGPIYLKEKVDLSGNLSEIFERISKKIFIMIRKFLKRKYIPKKQLGKIKNFKRLKEKNNSINFKSDLNIIYDQIRMLDDTSYPKAFIRKGEYKVQFFNAKIKKKNIFLNAKISKEY